MSSGWSSSGSNLSQGNVRPRRGRPVGYIPASFRQNPESDHDDASVKVSLASTAENVQPLASDYVPPHLRVPQPTALVETTENTVTRTEIEPTIFACSHPMCIGKFKTEIRLKEHKFEVHDYCNRCDLDFNDVSDSIAPDLNGRLTKSGCRTHAT